MNYVKDMTIDADKSNVYGEGLDLSADLEAVNRVRPLNMYGSDTCRGDVEVINVTLDGYVSKKV